MNEPRSNVSWRAAIKVAEGIVPAKVVNIASSGIQLQCATMLRDGQTYQMMMEVPELKDASQRTQVVCKVNCTYTILRGSEYRAGMRVVEMSPQHQTLLGNWGARPNVSAA
jgi:hypothetical protein